MTRFFIIFCIFLALAFLKPVIEGIYLSCYTYLFKRKVDRLRRENDRLRARINQLTNDSGTMNMAPESGHAGAGHGA